MLNQKSALAEEENLYRNQNICLYFGRVDSISTVKIASFHAKLTRALKNPLREASY